MPYVNVRIAGGATPEQKDEVIKGITDVLVRVLNKNPETTFVVTDEVPLDNWGHKGKSVSTLRKEGRA
ncbi:MAG: 4-oxalocrotonate tautomerase family protein [Devosia sp.]|nr:4-oxalocrotonate tautomerase family protein [Devosia sp.]